MEEKSTQQKINLVYDALLESFHKISEILKNSASNLEIKINDEFS
jgi:hypothetical protein